MAVDREVYKRYSGQRRANSENLYYETTSQSLNSRRRWDPKIDKIMSDVGYIQSEKEQNEKN